MKWYSIYFKRFTASELRRYRSIISQNICENAGLWLGRLCDGQTHRPVFSSGIGSTHSVARGKTWWVENWRRGKINRKGKTQAWRVEERGEKKEVNVYKRERKREHCYFILLTSLTAMNKPIRCIGASHTNRRWTVAFLQANQENTTTQEVVVVLLKTPRFKENNNLKL